MASLGAHAWPLTLVVNSYILLVIIINNNSSRTVAEALGALYGL